MLALRVNSGTPKAFLSVTLINALPFRGWKTELSQCQFVSFHGEEPDDDCVM
jgi:hypothetical protein